MAESSLVVEELYFEEQLQQMIPLSISLCSFVSRFGFISAASAASTVVQKVPDGEHGGDVHRVEGA